MGFLSWLLVETNAFELSVGEVSVLLSQTMFLGKVSVAWLHTTVEALVEGTESTEFLNC